MDWNLQAERCLAVLHHVTTDLRPRIEGVAGEIVERLRDGGKVMVCGNGGSAADAQHFAAELVNRFRLERRPYAGLALTTDSSILTSISNDYAYAEVFAKQVRAYGRPGDVLIGISTSGNADNVLQAVAAAKELDILTVGWTGGTGGALAEAVDRLLCISVTSDTPRIQEGHLLILHSLCELIEEQLQ